MAEEGARVKPWSDPMGQARPWLGDGSRARADRTGSKLEQIARDDKAALIKCLIDSADSGHDVSERCAPGGLPGDGAVSQFDKARHRVPEGWIGHQGVDNRNRDGMRVEAAFEVYQIIGSADLAVWT